MLLAMLGNDRRPVVHGIDRMLHNVQHGRFERSLSALPVASFSYSQCDNDQQLMRAAQSVMEDLLRAAAADEVMTIDRFAHLVGGARMAADEQSGVVNADCRTFAVPNLFITDAQRAADAGQRRSRPDDHVRRRTRRRPAAHRPAPQQQIHLEAQMACGSWLSRRSGP